jgi:hypothetical protein
MFQFDTTPKETPLIGFAEPNLEFWPGRNRGKRPNRQRPISRRRRSAESAKARDTERLIAYCDPSIELRSSFAAVDGAVYHGHDGIRSWHGELAEAWGEQIRAEPKAYADLGERMLVFFVFHGRGWRSGVEVAVPGAQVSSWRDGRMVYAKGYADRSEALRDVAVSEDELEPIAP